ncbi:methionyl-tRNA formyltransferase [Aliidongia dinghuensis]|uniref:Methionyl-tRNA formyltransferase n=1 Tax=Aliidongia dinghuensis TaxID=1867774 RepID=A0A8J3E3S1_9PROT|nr:methionyl-tRNA formyltransferase [Aliidongia dinghuensis]GGF08743.1 methionyl-tRNA formyltransferase [Aliidongia dinghuensis]
MVSTPLRLAFMGTPDFAVPVLGGLVRAGYEIAAVYCQPPRPTGRGHKTQPSPVQARAEALGLPVRHPVSFKPEEEKAAFAALGLDAAVVAAYGLILPRAILEAPRLGCLNVHGSLLPRWRGAAPIQRAIMAGDPATGITIMQMDVGLDTGAMLLRGTVPIGPETTAESLHDALAALGAELIVPALDGVAAGTLVPEPQPEDGVTYAAKLTREEGALDFREDAAALDRKIRALNPWPGVWFEHQGERIKVLAAQPEAGDGAPSTVIDDDLGIACGTGVLRPTLLQRPGRAPVERRAFLNGTRIAAGEVLPCPATN